MSFVKVTNHAKERALERFGFTEETLIKMAEKAVTEGFSINDAPSKEMKRYFKNKKDPGSLIYGYNGYVFILSKRFWLITAWRMPKYYLNTC